MEATAIDWSTARVTDNGKDWLSRGKPGDVRELSMLARRIEVTRDVLKRGYPDGWEAAEALVAAGAAEAVLASPNELEAPKGFAWLREGRKDERLLAGRACLYSQGW